MNIPALQWRAAQLNFEERQRMRAINTARGLTRLALGFQDGDATAARRAEVKKIATVHVAALLKDKAPPAGNEAALAPVAEDMVALTAYARLWIGKESASVKAVENLARELPVAAFWAGVRGVSWKALGRVVGYAGDLADYATHGKLVKFLAIAPPHCYPEGRYGGRLYSRRVRGMMHSALAEPLIRQNNGKYRAIYDDETVRYAARDPEKLDRGVGKDGKHHYSQHCRLMAERRMLRALVIDLWTEWREAA